ARGRRGDDIGRARGSRRSSPNRNLSRNLARRLRKCASEQAEGGRFELPRAFTLAVFKTAAFSLTRPPLRPRPSAKPIASGALTDGPSRVAGCNRIANQGALFRLLRGHLLRAVGYRPTGTRTVWLKPELALRRRRRAGVGDAAHLELQARELLPVPGK